MKKRVLVAIVPALASLAFALLVVPGTRGAASSSATSSSSTASAVAATPAAVSQNWAGYEVSSNSGAGFSSVSGEWTQPKLKCTSGQATYSAFWVGLGGGGQSSTALEQQGTQANCSAGGTASYYAWYELVPSAPVKIDMKISPGDQIYSRTTVNGDQVTVQVQNKTTGQNFVKTLTMTRATPDTSTAEWVAEAPSQCDAATLSNCSVLPLSDFGTVKFTNAQATSAGHTGSISDSHWTATPVALSSGSSSLLGSGAGGYLGGYGAGYGSGYGYSSSGYGYPYGSGSGYAYAYPGGYTLGYAHEYNAPYVVTTLGSGSGTAAPSTLSSDGSSFTVTYGDTAASSTSSSGSSSSSGTGYPYSSADPYGYSYGYYPGYGYSAGSYGGYGGAYSLGSGSYPYYGY